MNTFEPTAFYTGKSFDAYQFFGAHPTDNGTLIRVYAPNAQKVSLIGDFSSWQEMDMYRLPDRCFHELHVKHAKAGDRYKLRVYKPSGQFIDHSDPYGFQMEVRPQNASIISSLDVYKWQDQHWMENRTDHLDAPLNIYELHAGSLKKDGIKISAMCSWPIS